MNKRFVKLLSLLLCAVMIFGILPGFTAPPTEENPVPISQLASVSSGEFDENEYIVSYLNSLLHPLGALDLDDAAGMVSVIVTLKELPGVLYDIYSSSSTLQSVLGDTPDELMSEAAAVSRTVSLSYPIEHTYTEVLSGFAVTVPVSYAREIAKMPGVYAVTPDTPVYLTDEEVSAPAQSSVAAVGGPQHGMAPSLDLLRINELHEQGFTGAGIKVGVIDTGIDYNHPDLKDAYVGGYDFIDDDNDPMEATYEDWQAAFALDPEAYPEVNVGGNEYYTSHGTHVSGTIVGSGVNDSPLSTLGVAPDADLYVARVMGEYSSGVSSTSMVAIDDFAAEGGHLPKVDVINMSIGSFVNTSYTVRSVVVNNAILAGLNFVLTPGNYADAVVPGHRSPYTAIEPGTATLPITVGATMAGGTYTLSYNNAAINTAQGVAIAENVYLYVEGSDFLDSFADDVIITRKGDLLAGSFGYPLYPVGDMAGATTYEELAALEDGSLTGKILVIKRGVIQFVDMLPEALRLNAGALLLVNNQPSALSGTQLSGSKENSLPVLTASSALADLLALSPGQELYLDLGALAHEGTPHEIAFFSGMGPAADTALIKPDILAPGYAVLSTVPAFSINSDHNATDYSCAYQAFYGTSMAAPHVAGIAVLMCQAFPEATPAEIKARLMNTADSEITKASSTYPAPGGSTNTTQASVMEVGAGLVQPYDAIMGTGDFYAEAPVVIVGQSAQEPTSMGTTGSINFGYVPSGGTATLPIIMHNKSAAEKQVSLSSRFILSRYSGNAGADGVTLSFSEPGASVTIPAAAEARTSVTVSVPEGLSTGTIYEGYVTLTTGSDQYTIPFAVVVGASPVFDEDSVRGFISKPVLTTDSDAAEAPASEMLEVVLDYSGVWPRNEISFLVEDQFDNVGKLVSTFMAYIPGRPILEQNDIYLLSNLYYPIDPETEVLAAEAVPLPDGPYTLYATATAISDETYEEVITFAFELGGFLVNSTPPTLNLDRDEGVYIRSENGDYTLTGDASAAYNYSTKTLNIEYGGSLEPGDVVSVKANIYSPAIARTGLFDIMYNYDAFESWQNGGTELLSAPFDQSFNVLYLYRGLSQAKQHTDKDGNVWIDVKLPYAFSDEPIKIYDLIAGDCAQPLLSYGGEQVVNNMGEEYSISVSTDKVLGKLPFNDVSETDWFYADAQYVYAFGIMEGTSTQPATFSPRSQMTRAMVWTMLARLSGKAITGDTWIEQARAWATENGVSDGANPNGSVTRRQLATMLYRYSGGADGWPNEAMSWAESNKLISDGRPDDAAKRNEVAAIFRRYLSAE
ncbi:MAG: S8 family serine peptidase [Oscillospiraceae bacterium]|jgi:subtilisin family serine protease|nr:S8 family serine peptidase [Oscillospiraceae bacterium]